jgi:hypothetical protein
MAPSRQSTSAAADKGRDNRGRRYEDISFVDILNEAISALLGDYNYCLLPDPLWRSVCCNANLVPPRPGMRGARRFQTQRQRGTVSPHPISQPVKQQQRTWGLLHSTQFYRKITVHSSVSSFPDTHPIPFVKDVVDISTPDLRSSSCATD